MFQHIKMWWISHGHHHERWQERGYPTSSAGGRITELAMEVYIISLVRKIILN
jgi:response regulator RpfG family c-di-GMP phosphodiesterase